VTPEGALLAKSAIGSTCFATIPVGFAAVDLHAREGRPGVPATPALKDQAIRVGNAVNLNDVVVVT
jgi:hypothetical protein